MSAAENLCCRVELASLRWVSAAIPSLLRFFIAETLTHAEPCDQRFKNGRGAHTEHRDQQTDKPSGPPETQTSEKTQRSKGPGTTNTRGDKPQPQEESQANGGTNAEPGAKSPETVRRRVTDEGGHQRDLGRRGGRGTASTRGRCGSLDRSRNDRRFAPQQRHPRVSLSHRDRPDLLKA